MTLFAASPSMSSPVNSPRRRVPTRRLCLHVTNPAGCRLGNLCPFEHVKTGEDNGAAGDDGTSPTGLLPFTLSREDSGSMNPSSSASVAGGGRAARLAASRGQRSVGLVPEGMVAMEDSDATLAAAAEAVGAVQTISRWFWLENVHGYSDARRRWLPFSEAVEAELELKYTSGVPGAAVGSMSVDFTGMTMYGTGGNMFSRRCVQRVIATIEPRWFHIATNVARSYDPTIGHLIEKEYALGEKNRISLRIGGQPMLINLAHMVVADPEDGVEETVSRQLLCLSHGGPPASIYGVSQLTDRLECVDECGEPLYIMEMDGKAHIKPPTMRRLDPAVLNTSIAHPRPRRTCKHMNCYETASYAHIQNFQHICPNGKGCKYLTSATTRAKTHNMLFEHTTSTVPPHIEIHNWRRLQPHARKFRSRWDKQGKLFELFNVRIGSDEGDAVAELFDFEILDRFPRIRRVQSASWWSEYVHCRNELHQELHNAGFASFDTNNTTSRRVTAAMEGSTTSRPSPLISATRTPADLDIPVSMNSVPEINLNSGLIDADGKREDVGVSGQKEGAGADEAETEAAEAVRHEVIRFIQVSNEDLMSMLTEPKRRLTVFKTASLADESFNAELEPMPMPVKDDPSAAKVEKEKEHDGKAGGSTSGGSQKAKANRGGSTASGSTTSSAAKADAKEYHILVLLSYLGVQAVVSDPEQHVVPPMLCYSPVDPIRCNFYSSTVDDWGNSTLYDHHQWYPMYVVSYKPADHELAMGGLGASITSLRSMSEASVASLRRIQSRKSLAAPRQEESLRRTSTKQPHSDSTDVGDGNLVTQWTMSPSSGTAPARQ